MVIAPCLLAFLDEPWKALLQTSFHSDILISGGADDECSTVGKSAVVQVTASSRSTSE